MARCFKLIIGIITIIIITNITLFNIIIIMIITIITFINSMMMFIITITSWLPSPKYNIWYHQWWFITTMMIMQGLTKPRQMLVVKDTCMAAIEYFTEPGIHHTFTSHVFITLSVYRYLSHFQFTGIYHTFSSQVFITLSVHRYLSHFQFTRTLAINSAKKTYPPRHHGRWVVIRETTGEQWSALWYLHIYSLLHMV